MWKTFEWWVKRQLSRFPRLKSLASAVRRRVSPAFRGDAAGHWDARVDAVESTRPQGWLDSELVEREHIRPQISSDPDVSYLEHFVKRHLEAPVPRILSLGCGGGNLERALLDLGAAEHIDAYDDSPASIELAQGLADAAGVGNRLTYAVGDSNTMALPANTYDAVVIKMALHHFESLEHVYEQVAKALKPGGFLMFNEFVGPTRFQWTDEQLEHMNRLLRGLPKRLRRRAPVVTIQRPLVADMIALDPSESVRSADILPLLEERFELVELRPYGGTVLHILLDHILPLLDPDSPEDCTVLRGLMAEERRLLDGGILPSDFAFVVARPRPL